jgi:hypothetical protein
VPIDITDQDFMPIEYHPPANPESPLKTHPALPDSVPTMEEKNVSDLKGGNQVQMENLPTIEIPDGDKEKEKKETEHNNEEEKDNEKDEEEKDNEKDKRGEDENQIEKLPQQKRTSSRIQNIPKNTSWNQRRQKRGENKDGR